MAGGPRPGSGFLAKEAYATSSDDFYISDETPGPFLIRKMRDPSLSLELRVRIAQILLPYYEVPQRLIGKKARKQDLLELIDDPRFAIEPPAPRLTT